MTVTGIHLESQLGQRPSAVLGTLVDHAARVFRLSAAELAVLEALLARRVDGAGPIAAGALVAALAPEVGLREVVEALEPTSALAAFALLDVSPPDLVAVAAEVWPRFLGITPRGPYAFTAAIAPAIDELELGPVARAAVTGAAAWLRRPRTTWPAVVVCGPVGAGRRTVATALANELGCGAIAIDGARVATGEVARWRREIAWHQAAPVIADADHATPAALEELARTAHSPLFVTCATSVVGSLIGAERAVHAIELAAPTTSMRAGLWRRALTPEAAARIDCDALAERFRFAPERITFAARALTASDPHAGTDAAIALCRAIPELRIGAIATRLSTAVGWDDLVVPPHVRAELGLLLTWGRRRGALFAPDAVGGRASAPAGLACLLHGRPGTGKTLAAQVLAAELGRELYRVDLSQVVDKYIGETEKRLDLLFREAAAADVVLLFDEADALFAHRTVVGDAHDRYANLETGFLLQRLEEHPGLTLLATNLRTNIDPAFLRRLALVVELPVPAPGERRAIWDRLLPASALRAGDLDLDALARVGPLTGGELRNIVFTAILIADHGGETLAMRHVAAAIAREMLKIGKRFDPSMLGISEADLARYTRADRS